MNNENVNIKDKNVIKWKWTEDNIGDEGATKISESLMNNTTLTILNLNSDDKMYNT